MSLFVKYAIHYNVLEYVPCSWTYDRHKYYIHQETRLFKFLYTYKIPSSLYNFYSALINFDVWKKLHPFFLQYREMSKRYK
jgi:ribosomal protein L31